MSTATDFLASISACKRTEMAQVGAAERAAAREAALRKRAGQTSHAFRNALATRGRVNIIAEVKRSSPSAGAIRPAADPVEVARLYAQHGAAAISVLTEPDYFSGSLEDLRAVCAAVSPPALRKDFIVDAHQIYEAAAAGAQAVLLIVAALSPAELASLRRLAEEELGLDALVEVHSEPEMRVALDCGSGTIGVNNRNLVTLEVDLATSRELACHVRADRVLVSESGLRTPAQVRELRAVGYSAFLIGEALMRSDDPARQLAMFLAEPPHE